MRHLFITSVLIILALIALIAIFYPPILWSMVIVGPLIALGFHDYFQTKRAILRNFPLIGHARYLRR